MVLVLTEVLACVLISTLVTESFSSAGLRQTFGVSVISDKLDIFEKSTKMGLAPIANGALT